MDKLLCRRSRATKKFITSSWYGITQHIIPLSVNCCSVLITHNGFSFDFPFLVAEVKRRKLDEVLAPVKLYYADTLHDTKWVNIILHGQLDAASQLI